MKKIYILCTLLVMSLNFTAGCSEKPVSESGKSASVKIEDLDIKVDEVIDDGDREIMFCYTNNSDYTVTYMQLNMKLKSEITINDLKKYDSISEERELSDINAKLEYGDDDGYEKIDDEDMVKPGKTSEWEDIDCDIYEIDTDISVYDLFEPDVMTIQYIENDEQEHRIYYDYKNQKYSEGKVND